MDKKDRVWGPGVWPWDNLEQMYLQGGTYPIHCLSFEHSVMMIGLVVRPVAGDNWMVSHSILNLYWNEFELSSIVSPFTLSTAPRSLSLSESSIISGFFYTKKPLAFKQCKQKTSSDQTEQL